MARADYEANADAFGIPVEAALPCPGCGVEWTRMADQLERNHQLGCPLSTGATDVLLPPAKPIARGLKAKVGKLTQDQKDDEQAFQDSEAKNV